ncbi:MAG: radical SAM protein [Planctomycetes bacterium]|nr:radical SAM protein [Planctomycetota bacterium]
MLKFILNGITPNQLVIQYTDMCNAQCPQCGMNVTERFHRSRLKQDMVKKIIDAAVKRGLKIIQFTGGEPLMFFDEIVSLIKYAGNAGVKYILTGTNGFMFANHNSPDFVEKIKKVVEKLADTKVYSFWISIDSAVPEVHEKMRGLPGVIKGIEKALPIFHGHGIYPAANLLLNRNVGGFWNGDGQESGDFFEYFKNAIRDLFAFVVNMGFTTSIAAYPMSTNGVHEDIDPVYMSASSEDIVRFPEDEKVLLLQAYFAVISELRHKIRIFTPRSALYSLIRQYTIGESYCYPCLGGYGSFFIDAQEGNAYPCGYRGKENLGKYWEMESVNIDHKPSCLKCDWECFRDASEFFGPIQDIFTMPWKFMKRTVTDNQYIRLWLKDILYFRACDFFNGRVPPNFKKLSKFAGN